MGVILLLALALYCYFKYGPQQLPHLSFTMLPKKAYEIGRLFSGIRVRSSVVATPSESTALHLEEDPDAYQLHLELRLQVPKAASTPEDVLAATPELASLLPDLRDLLRTASPSPDYATLYDYKDKNLEANLGELQRLLPPDSLYDCQTILDLQNPETSRRAILVQALMNVNTDGSDGDRNFDLGKPGLFFQPQTNYRWPKASRHPNPYLHTIEQQIETMEGESGDDDSQSKTEPIHLKASLSDAKATRDELKRWSFLVGVADPFIVLPSFMFKQGAEHLSIGDYAIVIAKGKLYPAILGDKGPNFKIGEASLRICREIDPKSNADMRPVDRPKISYIIFPGTADKPFKVPNYNTWSERCRSLWKEMGGSDEAPWHEWKSLEKPWPTPTPTPTPETVSSPEPTSSNPSSTYPSSELSNPEASSGTNPAASDSPSPSPSPATPETQTNSPVGSN